MTAKERMAALLPDVPEATRTALLEDAGDAICAYTRRRAVPDALTGAQVRLAVILYNRMGTEGETSHSEGGVSRTMEGLPSEIERQMRPYRLAVIPNTHETAEGYRTGCD